MATKEQIIAQKSIATERYILSTMPVLYLPLYKLDGDTFLSKDAFAHLCTPTGTAPVWTSQGWSFPGTDEYIDLGNPASIKGIKTGITVEAWVKPGVTSRGDIASQWLTPNFHFVLSGGITAGKFVFYTSADGGATLNSGDSATTFNTTSWYHVVGSYDKAKIRIYVFGNEENSAAETADLFSTSTSDVYIGKSPAFEYTGLIGEVRIYNRALTPMEIQSNYLATKWRYR